MIEWISLSKWPARPWSWLKCGRRTRWTPILPTPWAMKRCVVILVRFLSATGVCPIESWYSCPCLSATGVVLLKVHTSTYYKYILQVHIDWFIIFALVIVGQTTTGTSLLVAASVRVGRCLLRWQWGIWGGRERRVRGQVREIEVRLYWWCCNMLVVLVVWLLPVPTTLVIRVCLWIFGFFDVWCWTTMTCMISRFF